jgi:chromosomal replication initiation ATPase DnaA
MSWDDMDSTPVVILKKQDRISYLLKGICEYYDISLDELQRRARKPEKTKRKRLAVKLLYDIGDCRYGDITIALGGTSGAAMWALLDRVNDDLGYDKELLEEYNDILKYLRV